MMDRNSTKKKLERKYITELVDMAGVCVDTEDTKPSIAKSREEKQLKEKQNINNYDTEIR